MEKYQKIFYWRIDPQTFYTVEPLIATTSPDRSTATFLQTQLIFYVNQRPHLHMDEKYANMLISSNSTWHLFSSVLSKGSSFNQRSQNVGSKEWPVLEVPLH